MRKAAKAKGYSSACAFVRAAIKPELADRSELSDAEQRMPAPPGPPAPTQVGPASNPLNVGIGNLFYGRDGSAAMSDSGLHAYKGDSSELIMVERPERGGGDSTALHMQNFLAAVKSRREQDLHIRSPTPCRSANLCDGFGLPNTAYIRQTLPPEPLADFGESRALGVRKPQSSGDVGAKDSILRNQIFALEEKALIDQPSHVRQQPCPTVVLHAESIW